MTERDLRRLFAEPGPPNPLDGPALRALEAASTSPPARSPWAILAALLGVAIGTWAVGSRTPETSSLTPKGAAGHGEVHVSWVVEGEGAPRAGDADIGAGERVVFQVATTASGFLCIAEERGSGFERVIPESGAWRVEPGSHMPRVGGAIAAWSSDQGPGLRKVRVSLDAVDPQCASPEAVATTTLRWLPGPSAP